MKIIGIDPGLQATGYGIISVENNFELKCLAAGVIRPASKEMSLRVLEIHEKLLAILHEFIPDAMSVEDLFTVYEHPKTAVMMGHARGVIFLAGAQRGIPVTSYAPTEVKSALTRNGRAGKVQVKQMVLCMLHLPDTNLPDHTTDALSLAICHAMRTCHPLASLKRKG
jgi:crossover junction endodeoxyribonuclease RuvC